MEVKEEDPLNLLKRQNQNLLILKKVRSDEKMGQENLEKNIGFYNERL